MKIYNMILIELILLNDRNELLKRQSRNYSFFFGETTCFGQLTRCSVVNTFSKQKMSDLPKSHLNSISKSY